MVRQYFFLPFFFISILALGWLSNLEQMKNLASRSLVSDSEDAAQRVIRQELMEDLDRLVSYEHYYHSLNGRFTLLLNRVGLPFSSRVSAEYDIRVLIASSDHLLVNAVSEKNGKIIDVVSVDQDYQVHANFQLPVPRRPHLKANALKYLRLMRQVPKGVSLPEGGVYRGYFIYSSQPSSDGQLHVSALGVKDPVQGEKIDLNSSTDEELSTELESILAGEWSGGAGEWSSEWNVQQEVLAQKIFLGETGRPAGDREELARVTRFQLHLDSSPGGSGLPIEVIDLGIGSEDRVTGDSHSTQRSLGSIGAPAALGVVQSGRLEIEPIDLKESTE
jgi:hypothetical protein